MDPGGRLALASFWLSREQAETQTTDATNRTGQRARRMDRMAGFTVTSWIRVPSLNIAPIIIDFRLDESSERT
jgi:hypothetical protein